MAQNGKLKILAVVVTHNRRVLLERCLDHLNLQARRPDQVLVVNNASNDGTESMLAHRGVRCLTQENLGSAGGWHRGISTALDEGFDAVWLMDDDGFPDRQALARLEEALLPGVACTASLVVREDNPDRFVFPHPVLDRKGLPVLFARRRKLHTVGELEKRAKGGTYPFAHFFNGALISCAAIKRVGNVNRDYFIFGEEVDYFFRLREAGEVCSVLAARHYHPDVSGRPYTAQKIYYYVKNTLVINRRYLNRPVQRNLLTVAAALGRTAWRNGVGEALSFLVGRRAPALYRAVTRGLRGEVGKDYHD